MTTLQEYLDQKYPTKEDKEIVECINLNTTRVKEECEQKGIIFDKEVINNQTTYTRMKKGRLKLSEYINLKKISLYDNLFKFSITELDVSNCVKLEDLYCKSELSSVNL